MGESDVPPINCMFIIGQLIHHACSSMNGPHALQLFIKFEVDILLFFSSSAFTHFKASVTKKPKVSALTFPPSITIGTLQMLYIKMWEHFKLL